ncbi:ATP-binding protein [Hydrogenivirga sp.]
MNFLEELRRLISQSLRSEDYDDGFFHKHTAFRLRVSRIEPVVHPSTPDPGTLMHVERQRKTLLRNTAQFVKGLPANDILLWGERGTGKSSLVKSLLKVFAGEGLRIVQVHKWEIPSLTELYDVLRDRPQRFILFFDDLSFEPHEDSFKLLKSLLEGDIEERPENVLVYATSNRRHLIPDVETEEKFPSESVQERVSLIDRFGIRLGFFAFTKDQYLDIVRSYADRRRLNIPEEELEREALLWATERGNFSGRTAHQFIRDLEGRLNLSSS